ncbi:MAG: hypothetical protein D6761_06530 [Candidatus Dadabacteria bacterium]|nr:MAG: hypothetical protein D6761_06530 [Candidatus Dadabacteria bacterium]
MQDVSPICSEYGDAPSQRPSRWASSAVSGRNIAPDVVASSNAAATCAFRSPGSVDATAVPVRSMLSFEPVQAAADSANRKKKRRNGTGRIMSGWSLWKGKSGLIIGNPGNRKADR